MPQSELDRARVQALVRAPLTDRVLDDLLFASKAELVAKDAERLTVSVTPDRLDLLSEGGLALELEGALGLARGLARIEPADPTVAPPVFRTDGSADPIRPAIAGALVRAPPGEGLDAGTLAEAIRVQELLHATVGRDRRAASLGLYPWGSIEPPVRYGLEPIEKVAFVPLDAAEETTAARFFEDHPMSARYGPLGRVGDRCLVLRDARSTVLSLPPILNGRAAGEIRVGDREILLESTGRDPRTVREAVGLLVVVFVARGWSVGPVGVEGPSGARDDGRSVVSPRPVDLASSELREIAGEAIGAGEVEHRLARCRLAPHPRPGGWRVDVPPWRPDLTTGVDLAEDVLLSRPLELDAGLLPPSRTLGRRRPETTFRRRLATELLGLGFAAPHTPLLVSQATVARVGGPEPIRLLNPVSAEFAYLRDRLFFSHLEVLQHNTRHPYPQRFAEIGPVVVRASGAEAGGETRYRAGLLVADERTGFAEVAALVDYVLRGLDVSAVREPAELGGTISGRSARARVAGETVAEMGEVHPRLLTELGVPVPTAFAELDLTALWMLVARREGP